ncbi:polymerase [Treponema sp. R80B11-R83G3]
MKKLIILTLIFFPVICVFGQAKTGISGAVEWDTLRINAVVSLNLAEAGIKLPAGRTDGESLLNSSYLSLIQPCLLGLQVDSSSTMADLVDRGELNLAQIEAIANGANLVAPALSRDMKNITTSVKIPISNISASLLRHSRTSPVLRTLTPISTARYTGIIIIALDELPVFGFKKTAMPVPCLFPKIWDSEMNLIYERYMLEPQAQGAVQSQGVSMVRYSTAKNIFQNNPSGLSDELREIVGDRPLRIFARGVFGIKPTDLIIERSDALVIISSEENRSLLSQGKVVFILDESVLSYEFGE